jgi:hypothetical protein
MKLFAVFIVFSSFVAIQCKSREMDDDSATPPMVGAPRQNTDHSLVENLLKNNLNLLKNSDGVEESGLS